MDLQYIFSKSYLFDATPPQAALYLPFITFFGFLLAFAVVLRYFARFDQKVRHKQSNCFLVVGLLGFLYLFARHEGLPWLGSRFFLSLILLTFIVWISYIVIWMIRYIPRSREKAVVEERFNKYLPKGHKGKENN